jgi:hypothetical protein
LPKIRIYLCVYQYHEAGGALRLATWVEGALRPVTEHSLTSILGKYGWMTLMVIVRIHFQALRLWILKSRFYKKPDRPAKEITS